MALYTVLYLLTLSSVCTFNTSAQFLVWHPFCTHHYLFASAHAVSSISCECRILQARFPRDISAKVQLPISDSKYRYPFSLLSLKISSMIKNSVHGILKFPQNIFLGPSSTICLWDNNPEFSHICLLILKEHSLHRYFQVVHRPVHIILRTFEQGYRLIYWSWLGLCFRFLLKSSNPISLSVIPCVVVAFSPCPGWIN